MDQLLAEATRCIVSDGDVAAFNSTWQTLLQRVHRRFFWLDRAQIEDAIGDVIVGRLMQAIAGDEEACQPAVELSVRSLYRAVCRRVGNSVRADKRHQHREREYARQKGFLFQEHFFVLNGSSAENMSIEDQIHELKGLLEKCSVWERAFVTSRLQGITDLRTYAELLGMPHCPLEELQETIHRTWNRIRMKLRRLKTKRK